MVTVMSMLTFLLKMVICLKWLNCAYWTSFKDLLIWEMHVGGLVGNFGRDKTIALVEDRFYWPSLKKKMLLR